MLLGALLGVEDGSIEYGVGSVVGGSVGAVGCVDGEELGSDDSIGVLLGCEDGCAEGVHSSQSRQCSVVGSLVVGEPVGEPVGEADGSADGSDDGLVVGASDVGA